VLAIPQDRWNSVKDMFDGDECYAIHLAQTGLATEFKGFIVDDSELSDELAAKLRFNLQEPKLRYRSHNAGAQ
jgi:hypothetical protein